MTKLSSLSALPLLHYRESYGRPKSELQQLCMFVVTLRIDCSLPITLGDSCSTRRSFHATPHQTPMPRGHQNACPHILDMTAFLPPFAFHFLAELILEKLEAAGQTSACKYLKGDIGTKSQFSMFLVDGLLRAKWNSSFQPWAIVHI